MKELIDALAWPVVVSCLLFILAVFFQKDVRKLIGRVKSVSKIEFEPQPQSSESLPKEGNQLTSGEVPKVMQPLRALADYEKPVYESFKRDLENLQLEESQKKEVLLRALTQERAYVFFERISRTIYGSQLSCLLQAHSSDTGITVERAKDFYEQSAHAFSAINLTFEQWLQFLLSYNLLFRNKNNLQLTEQGRDFLQRLMDTKDTAIRMF